MTGEMGGKYKITPDIEIIIAPTRKVEIITEPHECIVMFVLFTHNFLDVHYI